jgi:proteasome assembly chaperone (PAC2) family protein
MTFEHVIYIPGVLLLGVTVGYLLGARAVRAEIERVRKRMKE